MKSLRHTIVAAACAALALPAAAGAATISYDGSGAINYTAGGEKNYFGVYDEGGRLAISDSGAGSISYPADRCEEGYVSYVIVCDMPTALHASFGDGLDVADGPDDSIGLSATYDGGAGDDVLRSDAFTTRAITLTGGSGDDKLTGGDGDDTLNGGDGKDELNGTDGNDALHGDAGDDTLSGDGYDGPGADLMDGGPGFDSVESEWKTDYDSRDTVAVTLAGGADDGRAGEGDDLRSVEHVVSYAGGSFTGTDGPDDIDINQNTDASTVRGAGGDDRLDLNDGDDTVDGGTGADHIEGGNGHDHITGGPGADFIHGDEPQGECSYIYCKPPYGNDTIDARDGEVDQIACGVGNDVANVDELDVVSTDCETVNRPGGGGDNGGGGGDQPQALDIDVAFGRTSLKKALKKGIVVRVAASRAGEFTVTARRGSRVVARGKGTTSGRLKFTASARRALKRAKRVRLVVDVVYTANGERTTRKANLTLKR